MVPVKTATSVATAAVVAIVYPAPIFRRLAYGSHLGPCCLQTAAIERLAEQADDADEANDTNETA